MSLLLLLGSTCRWILGPGWWLWRCSQTRRCSVRLTQTSAYTHSIRWENICYRIMQWTENDNFTWTVRRADESIQQAKNVYMLSHASKQINTTEPAFATPNTSKTHQKKEKAKDLTTMKLNRSRRLKTRRNLRKENVAVLNRLWNNTLYNIIQQLDTKDVY